MFSLPDLIGLSKPAPTTAPWIVGHSPNGRPMVCIADFLGLTPQQAQDRATVNQRLADVIAGVEALYDELRDPSQPMMRLADRSMRQRAIDAMRRMVDEATDVEMDQREADKRQAETDAADGESCWPFNSKAALGI